MSSFDVILVLLVGVVATHGIGRALNDRIALPIIQIGAGALIGTTTDFGVRLEPDLFFVLFLPPLLFLDGWRIPAEDLKADAPSIFSLAFGLVFFTVAGIGLLLHALIPSMPLAVCFALAAVLSPTDVVAAGAIMANVRAPARVLRILEGEALFNDAAGLVCARLAITATMTGVFSPGQALATLAWTAAGGIMLGVASTWLIVGLKSWVAIRLGEETSPQIIISLLMPYAASLAADRLGCSAVLAAVAAGMTMSRLEMKDLVLPITRLRRHTVWETVQFALNGIIFLILGEQIPDVLARVGASALEDGHPEIWRLGLYVAIIAVALAALRFAWVWVASSILLRRDTDQPAGLAGPNGRLVAAMSVAGVRGAVTLAGALNLPWVLPGGAPFPARDLVICIAAGVIVLSLVLANLTLPRLMRGIPAAVARPNPYGERAARLRAAQAGLAAVMTAQERDPDPDAKFLAAAAEITEDYQRRVARLQPRARDEGWESFAAAQATMSHEWTLQLLAIKAERGAIIDMTRRRVISSALGRTLLRETDLAEASIERAPDDA